MTRVAILGSGPSLTAFDPEGGERFHCIIAVNRAATLHRCDWWSVADVDGLRHFTTDPHHVHRGRVIGNPSILTMPESWAAAMHEQPAFFAATPNWLTWERLGRLTDPLAPPTQWNSFSGTAALVLARHLGATEIHCFGMDLAGGSDAFGLTCPVSYNEERWQLERRIITRLTDWLEQQGVSVHLQPLGGGGVLHG